MTTPSARPSKASLSPTRREWKALAAAAFALVHLAVAVPAMAQDTAMEDSQDIVVPSHWSRYQAPTSYPEGTELHIIERGDTLWDLSNRYLENPFLWPQLWDANRYIENPHLIYPGDPLRIPELDVVRPGGMGPGEEGGPGGRPGGPGEGEPGEEGLPGGPGGPGGPGARRGPAFYPAYEEVSIQCASYMGVDDSRSMRIFGNEDGDAKDDLATGDIVYINRGSSDGVSPGDQYYTQRRVDFSFGRSDHYVLRTGWLTILTVTEDSAMAEITQACLDVNRGDYLTPFEPIPVPLLPNQPIVTRMTPETGRMRGELVASLDDITSLGEGNLVSINLGEEDGVVPGNIFTVFRYMYDDAPRKVLGELAVLTVQRRNATAKIIHSKDFIDVGDLVELK